MSKVDRDSRASSIKFLTKTFSPAPKHEFWDYSSIKELLVIFQAWDYKEWTTLLLLDIMIWMNLTEVDWLEPYWPNWRYSQWQICNLDTHIHLKWNPPTYFKYSGDRVVSHFVFWKSRAPYFQFAFKSPGWQQNHSLVLVSFDMVIIVLFAG
jgi:hypothetical protein